MLTVRDIARAIAAVPMPPPQEALEPADDRAKIGTKDERAAARDRAMAMMLDGKKLKDIAELTGLGISALKHMSAKLRRRRVKKTRSTST